MRFTNTVEGVMLRIAGIVLFVIIVICVLSFALLTDDPLYSGKPYDDEE